MEARSRGQKVVALLVCAGVPVASGGRVYTMYASTVTYRLDVAMTMQDGSKRAVSPGDLAGRVSHAAAPFLTGAESFRTVAQIDALRGHLADVARAGCEEGALSVEVVLHEAPLVKERAAKV